MNTISKKRRDALRQLTQEALAEGWDDVGVYPDELDALLGMADELDALKAERRRPDPSADLPGAERNEPHAPTVAAALREVGLCMAEKDFDADTLFERAAEIGEGREDG